jgi:hypothetical protein
MLAADFIGSKAPWLQDGKDPAAQGNEQEALES